MRNSRRARTAALWITALCAVLPASASGAVTVGNDLESPPLLGFCAVACTISLADLPASDRAPGGVTIPENGVIVRWRARAIATASNSSFSLVVLAGNTAVQRGAAETLPAPAGVYTFPAQLPVVSGQRLGVEVISAPMGHIGIGRQAVTGALVEFWSPPLALGAPPRAPSSSNPGLELFIKADVEPDADGDGFGDETQDQCPGESGPSNGCVPPPPDTDPPETEITKTPANKTEKPKAKFKFTSDEAGVSFECSLKGQGLDQAVKQFGDCASPRKYKRLDEGMFKFKVRATDAAGNVDSSPAKDKFRVVG
jgi:hypothetical protein